MTAINVEIAWNERSVRLTAPILAAATHV